ncbi:MULTISPECIES: ABC transporter substrate-binding protein [unclassified Bradyrhizobium]|uniref:ABC transporter substrate-binding protein n=1 Tax=unclassified Bradyrhizobium TaxID=2631580 RepID=UPI00247A487F|nr:MULTISPECIES: ABC transporter substrate-binding protein [unclassified Bradyrhizobium]WGR68337.1 ABC transporter substrate-binding protein [Bradyrhizobium sp. ISRA426]WGR80392.1 ABC transporter substrate-binding protein [Bradyrhizobium sp. ISRA430]WGR83577.1 ABC transporter substrate-binding protein [Bradyrhizobium sp. ISRA432]
MRFLRILLAASLACGVLAPASSGIAAEARRLNIVFVNPGKTGEVFWDMVSQTMQASGRKLNANIEVLTSERNYRIMQELGLGVLARTEKPDFLILSNEESAAVPIVEAAEAAGVKTLLLSNTLIGEDAARLGPPRQKLKTWLGDITTDLTTAGARMANALIGAARAEKWQSQDGKIHILGIGGDEITPASIARNVGLDLAVAAAPDVVVDRMLFANWTKSEAEHVTANYLSWASRKGIRPAGIWAGNDPMALGALRAATAAGLAPGRDIEVVGLNWSEEALREIKAGRLLLSDGGHFLLGGWSIVLLRDYADGCDFAAASTHIEVKTSAITRDNLVSVRDLIRNRAFDRIDFARFRAKAGACGHYDFSIDALISSLSPLNGAGE